MSTSLRLYIFVALVAVMLVSTAIAVQAQSGRATVRGVVGDETATRQGKFVAVIGTKLELHREKSESKFAVTTDDVGVYNFGRIPYGNYVLTVSAPGYRPYGLNFFVGSDANAHIAVLLFKE